MSTGLNNQLPSRETLESWSYDDFQGWLTEQDEDVQQAFLEAESSPLVFESYDSISYSPPSFDDFQKILDLAGLQDVLQPSTTSSQTTSASKKHADSADVFTSNWSLPVSESRGDSAISVVDEQREEVRSRFDELDPFLYQLTDADLAPIFEDSELFYDYVEHHGLQEAFMDDKGELVFIPVSAQQMTTILQEVFPVEMGIVPYEEGYSLTADAKTELLANESAWAGVDERFRILLDEELPGFIQFDAATKTKIFDAYTLNQDKFDLETFRSELHSFSTELEELHFLETQYGTEVSDKRPVMAMVIHGLLNGDEAKLHEIESFVILQVQISTLESLESMQRAIKGTQISESVSSGIDITDDINQLEKGNVSKFNPMGEDTSQEIEGLFDSIDVWQTDYASLCGKSQALEGDIVQLKKKVYEKIYDNLQSTSADPLVVHDFLVSIGMQPEVIPDSMYDDVSAAIETEIAQYEIGSYEYYYYSGLVDEARGKAFEDYESKILPGQLVEDFEMIQQEGWDNFYDPGVGSMNLFAKSYQAKITPEIVYQALDKGWTPVLAITGRRDSVEGWRFIQKQDSGEYVIQVWDSEGKVVSSQQYTQADAEQISAQDRSEETAQLRQSLEMDPDLAALREMSTDLAARLAPLQKLFSDSLDPAINKSQEFVTQLKLEIYEFQAYYRSVEQQYKQYFDQAGDALEFLKRYYWLLPEEEFAPYEGMMKQLEAFSPKALDDFIEQSTSKAYHADTLVEWAQRDGVVIVGAVIGSLVATALLVPSGGTSSLAYVAAVGALGGTIGTQAGMEFSGLVFDTELKSAHHRLWDGEMSFIEFQAELGTQFLTQFAFQYGAARLFQGYKGQIDKMLVSKDPKVVKFAQGIQKLESFRDAGKTKTLGHLAELHPKYGEFLAEFVEETGEEFIEEVVTDAAGPTGRLVMFWNLRSTKGIPGVTVFSQNVDPSKGELTVQFNYDAAETSSTMELLRAQHQEAIDSGQATLELDENTGEILLALTSPNSEKKFIQRYTRSLVPVEIRSQASLVSSNVDIDTYLEKEAGVKVGHRASEPYLYLKSGADAEVAIQKIKSMGFSLNGLDLKGHPPSMTFFSLEGGTSFSVELTSSAAATLEQSTMIDHSRSVPSQMDVSDIDAESEVETSIPPSVVLDGDYSIPAPANNNLHFNPLMQNPEIRARLSALADGRIDGEVEIYAVIDSETGEVVQYNFLGGQSESMGEVLLSVSEDGIVLDEEATANPQNPDFGLQEGQILQYMGHLHPPGEGYTVIPSVEDFNKFFSESVNEYYIMRQDAATGEMSWSRIYLDAAGEVQVSFSDPSLSTPDVEAALLADIEQAHDEVFSQGVYKAAATRERDGVESTGSESISESGKSDSPADLGREGLAALPRKPERTYEFDEFEMVREVEGGYQIIVRDERGHGEVKFLNHEQYAEYAARSERAIDTTSETVVQDTVSGQVYVDFSAEFSLPSAIDDSVFESIQTQRDFKITQQSAQRTLEMVLSGKSRDVIRSRILVDLQIHNKGATTSAERAQLSSDSFKAIDSMIDVVMTANEYGIIDAPGGLSQSQLKDILTLLYLRGNPSVRIDATELTHVPMVVKGTLDFYSRFKKNATPAEMKTMFLAALFHDSGKFDLNIKTTTGYTVKQNPFFNQSGQDIVVNPGESLKMAIDRLKIPYEKVPIFYVGGMVLDHEFVIAKNNPANFSGQDIVVPAGVSLDQVLKDRGLSPDAVPIAKFMQFMPGVLVHHDSLAVQGVTEELVRLQILKPEEGATMWQAIQDHGFVSSWVIDNSVGGIGVMSHVFKDMPQYKEFLEAYQGLYKEFQSAQGKVTIDDLMKEKAAEVQRLRGIFEKSFSPEQRALLLGDHQGQYDLAKYLTIHSGKPIAKKLSAGQLIFGDGVKTYLADTVMGVMKTHDFEQKVLSPQGYHSTGAEHAMSWLNGEGLESAFANNEHYLKWRDAQPETADVSVKAWMMTVPVYENGVKTVVFNEIVVNIEEAFYDSYKPDPETGAPSQFALTASLAPEVIHDPQVLRVARYNARNNPTGEAEIYYNPETGNYVVHGGSERGHLGQVIFETDETGSLVGETSTDQAQVDPEGLILIGDIHPAASDFGPIPSVDDIVRFLQENKRNPEQVTERVTLHTPDAESDPSWVRIYIGEDGKIGGYEASPNWSGPEFDAIIEANITQAELQVEKGVEGLRRQSSNDAGEYSKLVSQWWTRSGNPTLQQATVWNDIDQLWAGDFVDLEERNGFLVRSFDSKIEKLGRGRSPYGVDLNHGSVSKHHADIKHKDGTYYIRDAGSKNGIKIYSWSDSFIEIKGGKAVSHNKQSDGKSKITNVTSEDGFYQLKAGDVVVMGEVAFVVPNPSAALLPIPIPAEPVHRDAIDMEAIVDEQAVPPQRDAIVMEAIVDEPAVTSTTTFPESDSNQFGVGSPGTELEFAL